MPYIRACKVVEFLLLDLVVVIIANTAENTIYILVSDRYVDVVLLEEVFKELSELCSIQRFVLVCIILIEVPLDLL